MTRVSVGTGLIDRIENDYYYLICQSFYVDTLLFVTCSTFSALMGRLRFNHDIILSRVVA